MRDAIIIGQPVASGLLHILVWHSCSQQQLAGIVEPVCGYAGVNTRDITADRHHVEFIFPPGPELRAIENRSSSSIARFREIPCAAIACSGMPVSFVKNGSMA